jgi:hypothetical protein
MARRKRIADITSEHAARGSVFSHARRLFTIGPESLAWIDGLNSMQVDEAIVRLIPPANVTDSRIEEMRALAEAYGAVAVKVLPRAQIGSIGREQEEPGSNLVSRSGGLREAVRAVAARMVSQDGKALLAELDSVMDEVGL